MKFNDVFINKKYRFSIGIEGDSGKHYLSIPVSNGIVDYEEYYEISKDQYSSYQKNPSIAIDFLEKCKARQLDNFLFLKPGNNRGVAC
jgi:hypothetical protein